MDFSLSLDSMNVEPLASRGKAGIYSSFLFSLGIVPGHVLALESGVTSFPQVSSGLPRLGYSVFKELGFLSEVRLAQKWEKVKMDCKRFFILSTKKTVFSFLENPFETVSFCEMGQNNVYDIK